MFPHNYPDGECYPRLIRSVLLIMCAGLLLYPSAVVSKTINSPSIARICEIHAPDPDDVRELLSPWEIPFRSRSHRLPPKHECDHYRLTVLHHNDTHSHQVAEKDFQHLGGYGRIQTCFNDIREEKGNLLIMHGGDFMEGSIFYNLGAGKADIEVMNEMGYNAAVLGNHDWLAGPYYLCELFQSTPPAFDILSANLYVDPEDPPLNQYVREYEIYHFDGFKVGVFGLSTYQLIYDAFMEPIDILLPYPQAQRMVTVLTDLGCDLIIALSHLGLAMDLLLPFLAPGIDIVIGGHSHDLLNPPIVYEVPEHGLTYISQAGETGKFIGRWDLYISKEGGGLDTAWYDIIQVDQRLLEDPDVTETIERHIQEIEHKYGPIFDDQIGYTEATLDSSGTDAFLPNIAADAFRSLTQTDLALTSSNTFSGALYEGTFNTVDLYDAMAHVYNPYDDVSWQVHTFTMTGSDIQFMLNILFRIQLFDLSISGGEVVWDPDNFLWPTISIEIQGEPLDLLRSYTISANEDILDALYFVEDNFFLKLYDDVQNSHWEAWRVLRDHLLNHYGGYLSYDDITAEKKARIRTIHPDLRIRPEEIEFYPRKNGNVLIGARIRNVGEGRSTDMYYADFLYDATPGDFRDDPNPAAIGRVYPGKKLYGGEYRDCHILWNTGELEPSMYPIMVTIGGEAKERELSNNTAIDYVEVK
jgi:5'-nucleotidase